MKFLKEYKKSLIAFAIFGVSLSCIPLISSNLKKSNPSSEIASFYAAPEPVVQANVIVTPPPILSRAQITPEIIKKFPSLVSLPTSAPPVRLSPIPVLQPSQWARNAVIVPEVFAPKIVLVIDDLGVDYKRTARIMNLRAPLTLSFLPYAHHLKEQTQEAHMKGHELMVHVPMEPESGDINPGPNVLKVSLSPEEIRERLQKALSSFSGYVGFNNHMGSRFTAHSGLMSIVLEEAQRRGILFLDSVTTAKPATYEIAYRFTTPVLRRDVFIDHDPSPQAIAKQLARMEAIARRKGVAIGIGHPYDSTIEALTMWISTLKEKGIELVPISALAFSQRKEPQMLNASAQ